MPQFPRMLTVFASVCALAGCLTVLEQTSDQNVRSSSPTPGVFMKGWKTDGVLRRHRLRILTKPPASEGPVQTSDLAVAEQLAESNPRPAVRQDIHDCGYPGRPFYVYPGAGGDVVSPYGFGNTILYDVSDTPIGPSNASHDTLVLPGDPDEPEIHVSGHTVVFCYPERQLYFTLYRQLCRGTDWNNTFEAITFDGGASFVSPDLKHDDATAAADNNYMTKERAERFRMDWLTEKRRANWATYPMPKELLPSPDSISKCTAD